LLDYILSASRQQEVAVVTSLLCTRQASAQYHHSEEKNVCSAFHWHEFPLSITVSVASTKTEKSPPGQRAKEGFGTARIFMRNNGQHPLHFERKLFGARFRFGEKPGTSARGKLVLL
jgi:hypothetical protein